MKTLNLLGKNSWLRLLLSRLYSHWNSPGRTLRKGYVYLAHMCTGIAFATAPLAVMSPGVPALLVGAALLTVWLVYWEGFNNGWFRQIAQGAPWKQQKDHAYDTLQHLPAYAGLINAVAGTVASLSWLLIIVTIFVWKLPDMEG